MAYTRAYDSHLTVKVFKVIHFPKFRSSPVQAALSFDFSVYLWEIVFQEIATIASTDLV